MKKVPVDFSRVIMVTSNYWDGFEYQRHHFTRQFAGHGIPVIFVERSPQRWPRFGLKDISEWFLRTGQGASGISKQIPENVHVVSPWFLPPARFLRPLNRRIIKNIFSKVDLNRKKTKNGSIVITYVPSYNTVDLIHLLRPDMVAYVNVHNYGEDDVMPDLLEAERELAKKADVLFADSTFHMTRLSRLSGGREVCPSLPGVDYDLFRRACRGDEAGRCGNIFYFGSIKRDLDFALYEALASRIHTVFIGAVAPGVEKEIPPDIEVRPPVSAGELPSVLKDADIIGLFYRDCSSARGTIPAKLFECLAAGKPVLVSGLSEAGSYSDVVYDVSGSAERALEIIRKLPGTETAWRLARRDEIAKEADWSKRFEAFAGHLRNV